MRAFSLVVVGALLGVLAGCGRAERSRPVEQGRAEAARREARRPPAPVLERRLAATPGSALEATLAGAQSHLYRLDLTAGRFADLTVDQRGVDVVVVVRAPGGHLLRRVDSLNGALGPEPVPFITEEAGSYRVEVRAPDAGTAGRYAIVLQTLRPPTPRDRTLVAAEETMAAGEELRRRGGEPALRRAVEHHRRALALFHRSGAGGREADGFLALGEAYLALGEGAAARQAHGRALALYRTAGRTRQMARAVVGLGRAHRLLGEDGKALERYREALALSRKLGERRYEVEALGNLGRVHAALGKTEDALAFYEQALAGCRGLGLPAQEASILNNLGQLYLELGEVRQAIDRFEEALAILERTGDAPVTGTILTSLGDAYVALGEPGKGIEYLQRALRLHRRAGNRREEAVALNDLGLAHRQAGALEEARRYYRRALVLHRALGHRSDEASTLHNLGWVHDALGDPGTAVELYRQALSWFTAAGDRRHEAATLFGVALARRHLGDLEGALAAIEAALARLESLRIEPAASELRASYLASKQQYFAFSIDLLMELHRRHPTAGHDARAFEASERVRARSLLEDLTEAAERRSDGQLALEEAELARRLHSLEMRRREPAATGAAAEHREAVERELRRVVARHRRVRAALRGGSAPRAAVSRAEPRRLQEIQRRVLDGETLLLEYSLGEERSFLWAVTSTSLASFELPGRATIEAAARRAYALLPESHRRTARAQAEIALQDLSRLLLGPVADRLGARRLVVVADGVLHYLPFAALPVPAAGAAAGAGRRGADDFVPLVVEHEVVTLPSASTADVLRRRHAERPQARATVAVLADPVFSAIDPRCEKPQPAAAAAQVATATYRAPLRGSGRDLPAGAFPRLPFSRQEAAAILELVPADQELGLLSFDARRETALSGSLDRFRYVHFATHGVLDTAYPELSGLVLSLVDRRGRPENGFLRAHEIADLKLSADLVVLSACRTALGKEIRGEGLVGLTRAFLDAGADGVLVSLWHVEDRATAELMRRLYEGMLRQGLSPAAALRSAQVALWRQGEWRAPSYWAGFVLQGDWQ